MLKLFEFGGGCSECRVIKAQSSRTPFFCGLRNEEERIHGKAAIFISAGSVPREDDDINNDGKTDKSDSYLHNRRKAIKKSMMKESVPFTFVIENSYDVEIPTNLTYADYLDAVKTIVNSEDPEFQQDIVKPAAVS